MAATQIGLGRGQQLSAQRRIAALADQIGYSLLAALGLFRIVPGIGPRAGVKAQGLQARTVDRVDQPLEPGLARIAEEPSPGIARQRADPCAIGIAILLRRQLARGDDQLGRGGPTGLEAGVQRIRHGLGLCAGQAIGHGDQFVPFGRRQFKPIIAGAAHIGHQRALAIVADRRAGLGQQLALPRPAGGAQAQRNAPAGFRCHRAHPRIAALADLPALSSAGKGQQRDALLVGKALHRRHDPGITRSFSHGCEEFGAGRVAIAVRGHVAAHPFAELVVTHIARNHRDHVATLAIGDRIESLIDLTIGLDRLADRTPRHQRIGAHGIKAFLHGPGPDVQGRPPFVADAKAHPVGEAFVQPDIVPPGRGNEIAKPLVRQLVTDDHAKAALLARRGLFIQHQQGIVIEVRPGVLHRPRHDRRGDLVQLGIGERFVEIGL